MKILVTSGGTKVPIDDVRYLSNNSSGKTGSEIAKQALINNHEVIYMHSDNAIIPFQDEINTKLNFSDKINIEEKIEEIKKGLEIYNSKIELLEKIPIKDFYDYSNKFVDTLEKKKVDVVILSMAASDYGIKKTKGKISSDKEKISLQLEKLPKMISLVQKVKPEVFLVGFKLLTYDYSKEELVKVAKASVEKNSLDLIVANIVSKDFKPIKTFIIRKDLEIIEILERKDLARILIKQIELGMKK